MPTLFLANADTEAMVADPRNLDKHFRQFSAGTSRRHLWMMSPGDAIVLPSLARSEHIHYIEDMCQYDRGSLRVLHIDGDHQNPYPLDIENLSAKELIDQLQAIGFERGNWSVEPYIADQVAFHFSKLIDVPIRFGDFGTPVCEAADVFNDKRVFRALAAGLNVPTAPGCTCASLAQLTSALAELTPATGSVIVKLDRHSGTAGNVLVTTRDIQNAPGAHKIHRVSAGHGYEEIARTIYAELSRSQNSFFVVESYYHSALSVGVHYLVGNDGITLNGVCDMRLLPSYAGMFWPSSLSEFVVHKLLAEGQKLAYEVGRLGHRGPVSIDAIVCPDDKIMISEINARHGGFSMAKAVIEKIVVQAYPVGRVMATRLNLTSQLDFKTILALLDEDSLGFSRTTGKGVIVYLEDLENTKHIEIFSVAESREELENFENRFVQLVCQ